MNQPNARTLTLFDLLARRWQVEAPIVDACFTVDGGAAAFSTAGGSVLIAASPDPEPPESRIRVTGDLGQITIRPRTVDPAPLITVGSLADGAPPLAAADAAFLVGDGDGRVLRLDPDGATQPVATVGGAVAALAHAAGVTAASDHGSLTIVEPAGTRRIPLPGLHAVAVAPDGRIAAANAAQLILVEETDRAWPLLGAGRLAWRADGRWLAAGLGTEGVALLDPTSDDLVRLRSFPAAVRSLAWSAPAAAFVAAGAFRVAAWDAAALPATDNALVTGQPGLVVVETVATHPTRPLVAAGYANGQVAIAQIGSRAELLLRQDGAAVTALAFSPDGRHLAIGDAAGTVAIVTFPPQMFK